MAYKRILKECRCCGLFSKVRPNQIYCSVVCYSKMRSIGKVEMRQCLTCGEVFKIYFSQINRGWGKGKYCSQKCYHTYPRSQEFKDKISKAFRGCSHPRWKGGITEGRKERNHTEYQNWRKLVFARDRYTCRGCKARNGNGKNIYLEAHHIKSWEEYLELRYVVENGLTLCDKCHESIKGKEMEEYGFDTDLILKNG